MPYSPESNDQPIRAADHSAKVEDAVAICCRCGDWIAVWEEHCPSCGRALKLRTHQAVPVAPPADEDLPFALEEDTAEHWDLPVAEVVTDEFGVPRRKRRRRRIRKVDLVGWQKLMPLVTGYTVMLALSMAFGVLLVARAFTQGMVTEEEQNWGTFTLEVLDAVLVLAVGFTIGKLPSPPLERSRRATAWVAGLPLLSVLLVLNIGSVLLLRRLFHLESEPGPPITAVTLLLICVQPAIVEEWFFRHLALGSLREKYGTHWAVWISSVMFAAAHIYNPIAMPYLLMLGVSLGYLRVHSGGLALPMTLHFLHNLAVVSANHIL